MSSFVEVSMREELKEGTMKTVSVGGRDILLARVGDKYYATENRCPHMRGELSLGTLNGTIVTCPLHHSQFDLADGRVVRWTDWSGVKLGIAKLVRPPRSLKTYEVEIDGDKIFIGA